MTPQNNPVPQPTEGGEELRKWYKQYAYHGDFLDRDDGTIGAIESKKEFAALQSLIDAACKDYFAKGVRAGWQESGEGWNAEWSSPSAGTSDDVEQEIVDKCLPQLSHPAPVLKSDKE